MSDSEPDETHVTLHALPQGRAWIRLHKRFEARLWMGIKESTSGPLGWAIWARVRAPVFVAIRDRIADADV